MPHKPRNLQAVVDAQREISSVGLDLDVVMATVVRHAQSLTDAAGGVIELAEGDEMVYRGVSGSAAGSLGVRLRMSTSLSGLCVRTGEILVCRDADDDPRVDRDACRRVGVRSMVVVPLRYEGRVVGVLKVLWPEPDAFTSDDVLTLEMLAGMMGSFMAYALEFEERRRMERELARARDEALEATRLKSQFLATMSHEIRTPMNAVIGMTSLLLDTRLDAEQREYAETIRMSGDALLALINNILDFSKIEAGELDLERHPFDLRDVVEEALDLIAPAASTKGVDLLYEIKEGTPAGLLGDVTRLRQVLVNLVNNAVKFTREGHVLVTVSRRDAGEETAEVQFSVTDTGIGIPPDRIDRLFKSFSQVDSSTTRKYGGTGLGLVICKRLAEAMGGHIWVESEPGRGSTFSFTVRAEPAAVPPRAPLQAPPRLAGRRLLVVDDNPVNRAITSAQAEKWGLSPVAVGSGVEALDLLLRGERFDVAVLDMQMPEMDGVELARRMREIEAGARLPLILLTSLDGKERLRSARPGADFAAVLTKPARQSELYDALAAALTEATAPADPAAAVVGDRGRGAGPVGGALRILLAEDNPVNQRVALRILERLGHRADIASNGMEVLAALHRQPYDVILMDVQMPEMDGLEATRRVRERHPAPGPYIVAMTANALKGDQEECLRAGMDDYLSKPVRPFELGEALTRAGRRVASATAARAEGPPGPEGVAPATAARAEDLGRFDRSQFDMLRDLTAGEPGALAELIAEFVESGAQQVAAIREAIQGEVVARIELAAHTLKGGASAFGAPRLAAMCSQVEAAARTGDIAGARGGVDELEREFGEAVAALRAQVSVEH